MKCRYLREENDIVCAASTALYVPSVFEAEEYCFTDRHLTCSSYCIAMADGLNDPGSPELQSQVEVQ
jgi:hypothetical protein